MPRKDFKLIINGRAEHDANGSGPTEFQDAANEWFKDMGKKSLEYYFKAKGKINHTSSLDKFDFNTVDKEVR